MTEFAHPATDYGIVEQEPPGIMQRNLHVAARLWASATVFFFFAFLFAYFYLRSLDQGHLFRPKGIDTSQGWGIAIVVCVVASALLLWSGQVDQGHDRRPLWRLKGLAALVLGLLAVVFQILAWSQLPFGATGGGFASVYLGWTGLYTVFLVATLYWLETCLALSFRYRNEPFGQADVEPGHASGDPDRTAHDIANPVHLNTAELAALSFYWSILAAIGVVTWIVLYLL